MAHSSNPQAKDEVMRMDTESPEPALLAQLEPAYLVFWEDRWLVPDSARAPLDAEQFERLNPVSDARFVARCDGRAWYAATLQGDPPEGWQLCSPRDPEFADDPMLFQLVSRAVQLLRFQRQHRHCVHCAGLMELDPTDAGWYCGSCGRRAWAPVSPAVIVLIERGDECLLVRRHSAVHNRFSLVSGFVEAGESAEHAVHREVFEETGIELGQIRYFGSQSWPFPHQLMLG